MFYEQRGPLVFSASLHLCLVVGAAIWLMVAPPKEPEELVFELVSPPSGASEPSEARRQEEALPPIRYQREEFELPSLNEIVLPERPPVRVEVPMPQERPAPEPEPVVEEQPVVEAPPPPTMSLEEFLRQNPNASQVQNVRTTPRQTTRQIDLTEDVRRLRESLSNISIASMPSAQIEAMSASDQQAISSYYARLAAALKRAVESHPRGGQALRVRVGFDISGAGRISNIRVITSSGDPAFDQKALAGLRRIQSFEAPPERKPQNGVRFWFEQ